MQILAVIHAGEEQKNVMVKMRGSMVAMVQAYVKGLQGNDPKYWMTASLMKHFLANSNEK